MDGRSVVAGGPVEMEEVRLSSSDARSGNKGQVSRVDGAGH